MPKLSVHLIAWNGAKYIPYLLASLRAQTYKDWELLAIDNGSKDGTADLIEKELKDFPVPGRLVRNEKNLGFAGGHNQAVRIVCHPERSEGSLHSDIASASHEQGVEISRSARNDNVEYVQLLNQDMYLAPDYFARVVAMMDEHREAGAGQGVLLKWDFSKMTTHNPPQSPLISDALRGRSPTEASDLRGEECGLTDMVDTMGLKVMRNRRVVDFRTGEIYGGSASGQTEAEPPAIEVFGVSGALPIYRRKAIEEVMFEGQMFDEDFFMYKEDVDLAFRLRAAGWKAYVVSEARAWHDRSAAGPREMSDRAALENRRTKSVFINYHSYKNHLLVLLKNEQRANFVHDWPAIVWYEFKKFVYLLFTDLRTLKGLLEVCKLWKRTMEKREFIMQHYRVKPEEMRVWFK